MIYEVIDLATGKAVELDLPMADAPKFGVPFRHSGRTYERKVSFPAISMVHGMDRTGATKAWSMPRKGSPDWKNMPEAPHYDKDGFAVFRTQREIDTWMKKGGAEKYQFDRSGNVGDEQEWVGKRKTRRSNDDD